MNVTRRQTLLAGAALPFAGSLTLPAAATAQEAPALALPTHRDFAIGDFRVTTLLAGSRAGDNPQETFGMNVSAEEFAAVSAANYIPADRTRNFFTPVVVKTGAEVILFDTGLDAGGITTALAAAGYAPGDITHVVLTHMHGDHIGGLSDDAGTVTFANAAYITGQTEYDNWAAAGNEGFDAKVRPLADRMTFLADGGAVTSGITAMALPGHTPGHMGYMLDSGGQQLAILADMTNHYVWSLAHPDWEVRFDADKAQAAATRRATLGMLAADRVPMVGYHMPFPAMGFVETRGDGFHWVPVSYQFM
jgi:glyoxylase-like metal-dependent hydrolase (beta-lactamase superfamily II)